LPSPSTLQRFNRSLVQRFGGSICDLRSSLLAALPPPVTGSSRDMSRVRPRPQARQYCFVTLSRVWRGEASTHSSAWPAHSPANTFSHFLTLSNRFFERTARGKRRKRKKG
jgi:CelD/BcsL family acetyltransferase involved in cellulose biosynthesis